MGIYICIFAIVVFNFTFHQKKQLHIINFLVFTFLMLVCALRNANIGVDTENYLMSYSRVWAIQERESLEFIYKWIVLTLNELNFSPSGIQFVMSTISFSAFYYLFRTESRNTALSILLFVVAINYYFFESFNIVRQLIATPFLLLAYTNINRGSLIKAAIFLAIALGFHMSSVICIPIIAIAYYVRFNYKIVVCCILGSLAAGLFMSSFNVFGDILNSLFSQFDLGDMRKYEGYANYKSDWTPSMTSLICRTSIPSFLVIWSYNKLKGDFFIRVYALGVILLNLLSILPVGFRIVYGLTALDLLIIPNLWSQSINMNQKDKIILSIIIIFYLCYRLTTLILSGVGSMLVPYSTFL